MPPAITIKIDNLDIVRSMANRYPAISQRHIDDAIVRSIGEIDVQTKPLTPVKTGRLRSSLLPRFAPFQGIFGTKVPYAVSVHDLHAPGTRYRRPSLNKKAIAGFLTVGVKRSGRVINTAFQKALDNIAEDLSR